ncbi:MAG: metallophosphoesterase [Lentisphaeria bacterium]|nr:metallophosphoesterase [Lentisphaeria bacterium]
MKIIHFSDPHAGGGAEDFMAYFDKRWVGVFNYRFRRRFRHDLKKLELAVEYILDTRPDAVVCTGDLTSTGQPGEFAKVRPILEPLRNSGIPFIYTPGNHDCYVRRPQCVRAVNEMVEFLSGGNYGFGDMPFTRRYGNCEFIVFNTSRPSNLLCSWGFVKREDVRFIESVCEKPKHCPRILVNHYPLEEDFPLLRIRHRLFGQKRIKQLLEEKKIDLALCGHVHKPTLRVDADGRGECIAGSVTRNGTMVAIDYDPLADHFKYETIHL